MSISRTLSKPLSQPLSKAIDSVEDDPNVVLAVILGQSNSMATGGLYSSITGDDYDYLTGVATNAKIIQHAAVVDADISFTAATKKINSTEAVAALKVMERFGWAVGATITVADSLSNDGDYTITAVDGSGADLTVAESLVDEADTASGGAKTIKIKTPTVKRLIGAVNNQSGKDPFSTTNFGPEMSFAYKHNRLFGTPLYVLCCSKGGTSMAEYWNTTAPEYLKTVIMVNEAVDLLQSLGKVVKVYYLWSQGEGDADNLDRANNYQTRLQAVYDGLMALDGADRFIIAETSTGVGSATYLNTVRAAQEAVAAANADCEIFDTAAYDTIADGVHYNWLGIDAMGKSFADEL